MKTKADPSAQALLQLDTAFAPEPARTTPGYFLANKDRLARWCVAALLVSGAVNVLALALLFQTAAQPPWFVTLDPLSGPEGGQGTSFEKAREIHIRQALDAASVLLYRSQGEFDFGERLPDLFALPAVQAANKLKADEAQEFRDKAISQKAHIARVEALETRPDLVRVAVSGKLVRNGQFHQHPFTEVIPFTLRLTFRFNPDLLCRGRFPTLVEEFQLKYEKAE